VKEKEEKEKEKRISCDKIRVASGKNLQQEKK